MDDWLSIMLYNDDKSLYVKMWFFGYTVDAINKYIEKKYSNSKRWTQVKWAQGTMKDDLG